jgi:N-methylhydantoinase A
MGNVVAGPAIVEERESTLIVPPGARCDVDAHRNLVVTLAPVER